MEYALVAGGSKGIGYAIAEALARRRYNLILIGRHIGALNDARQKLQSKYKIEVEVLQMDLSTDEAAEEILKWLQASKLPLKILCNVAGLGGAKDFLTLPLEQVRYMVRLNIESDAALCMTLIPLLEKNNPAYILNVGSMAGFSPIPVKNMYAATKSAVIFFSYGLRYQLKNRGISVSCLCPGPVFTKEEIRKDTIEKLGWFGKMMAVNPADVGEIAVRRTLNGRMIIIPGLLAKTMGILLCLLPRRLIVMVYDLLGGDEKQK